MSKREQINKLLGRPEASHEEEPTDQSLTTPEVYIETIVGAAPNVPPQSTSMQTRPAADRPNIELLSVL